MVDKRLTEAELLEHMNVFLNLTVGVLRRREMFRAFEKGLIDSNTAESTVKSNGFINIYISDYLRGQLIDLRKFFETDTRSYKISHLVENISGGKLQSFDDLSATWKNKFEAKTNKVVTHLDKDTPESIKEPVEKVELDAFIDRLEPVFNDLVDGLRASGHPIAFDPKYGSSPVTLSLENQGEEFKEFLKIVSQS